MSGSNVNVEQAIEVFVRGFAFTRGFTHPYLAERLGAGLWVMRDAPRERGDYRGEEYVAYGMPASTVHEIAASQTRGRYGICAIRAADESDAAIRADYRVLGYRLMSTEPFMAHALENIAPAAEPLPVVRIATRDQADRLASAARRRQILPGHLSADPPPMRQYAALDGDRYVGWVGSVCVEGGRWTWCSNLYVEQAYRRRGVARALLTRMLRDDREAGAHANVLLASHTGAKLYPTVGYALIGELLMFKPPR